jgi:hypothetical protein
MRETPRDGEVNLAKSVLVGHMGERSRGWRIP